MSGFFGKAKEVAKNAAVVTGEAAKRAAEKTQETIEVTKVTAKIKEEKENIGRLKSEIGHYFLEKYDLGELTDAFVATKAEAIQSAKRAIHELEQQINNLKDK